jgi:hypothetical protein
MFANVFDMLFGCWHKNYTFPITAKKGTHLHANGANSTYVVCLDCGKEFPYDWNTMKVLSPESETDNSAPLTVEHVSGYGKVA